VEAAHSEQAITCIPEYGELGVSRQPPQVAILNVDIGIPVAVPSLKIVYRQV
jgi:hypothetical protein